MSTGYQKCQWVVVHKGGQPIRQIDAEMPFLQPFNVSDAARGIGFCGIQSNSLIRTPDGKDHGLQNILMCEPGKLTWRVELPVSSGTGSLPSEAMPANDDLLKLNQQSLGTIINTVRFSIVNQGNRVYVSLMLKDLNGSEVKYIEQDLPGKYVGDILSSYVRPCGWGGGTQANFDPSFSTKIVYRGDSALQTSAWNKETPPVPFCLSNENNNLYQLQQDLQGLDPNEVSVVTAYGSSD